MNSEKGVILLDGGYIKKIERKNKLRLDYLKLSNIICSDLNLNRLRTYFYYCLPIIKKDNEIDKKRYGKIQEFLSKLKRLSRFEIKLGKLQFIDGKFRQKMVDVLMSLDIVNVAFEKQAQHIILVAGDSDFVPAVRKAKNYGVITHLYYLPSSVHNELMDEVDELHKINKEFIARCKLENA